MLEFLDKERVAAAIPETKAIFRAGLAGEEFDFFGGGGGGARGPPDG